MKKVISVILVIVLLSTSLSAFARASYYISAYGVGCVAQGNGDIKVTASITGTHRTMTKIGFPTIILHEMNDDDEWIEVDMKAGQYNPNVPAGSHTYTFIYQGTAGKKYYAYSSFFAKNADGDDWREANSFTATAY